MAGLADRLPSRFQSFQQNRTAKEELEELRNERAAVEKERQQALLIRLSIDSYRKETEADREKLNKEKLSLEDFQKKTADYQKAVEKKEQEILQREEELEHRYSLSLQNLSLADKLHKEGLDLKQRFETKLNKINEIATL